MIKVGALYFNSGHMITTLDPLQLYILINVMFHQSEASLYNGLYNNYD